MKKIHYTDQQTQGWVHNIMRGMQQNSWRPDYVVGLTRGGLIPAVMISHYLNVPMHTIDISLRDSDSAPESNLWMPVDAYGHETQDPTSSDDRKQILIVDDINDSGATLKWLQSDWQSSCMPRDQERWTKIWNHNVRFAVLINNTASGFQDIDYSGTEINKQDDPEWCVFPWEAWWI